MERKMDLTIERNTMSKTMQLFWVILVVTVTVTAIVTYQQAKQIAFNKKLMLLIAIQK